ncbi:MAG: response regulator [Verrucomicrobiota bacterium]|nr:response regulator [Verrucomicrobiota bacterium]MCC6820895.1 response regulator [Limisphaerales bacterium]
MEIALKLATPGKWATHQPPQRPKEKQPFAATVAPVVDVPSPPAAVGAGRRILVVDDNPVVLKAFEFKLKASGFAVTTISDATNAASVAEKTAAELIVLDINFPSVPSSSVGLDWNGYTIMHWLRRFPKLSGIPVILISGEEARQHREKALAAGAVAFFEKPVPYADLLAAILPALGIQA